MQLGVGRSGEQKLIPSCGLVRGRPPLRHLHPPAGRRVEGGRLAAAAAAAAWWIVEAEAGWLADGQSP